MTWSESRLRLEVHDQRRLALQPQRAGGGEGGLDAVRLAVLQHAAHRAQRVAVFLEVGLEAVDDELLDALAACAGLSARAFRGAEAEFGRRRTGFAAHLPRGVGGGAEGDRTPDLLIANEALSQLSYSPYFPGGGADNGCRAACQAMRPMLASFHLIWRPHLPRRRKQVKKTVQTDQAPKALGPYSQAIVAGGMVYCAGQIPLDPATGDIVAGGIAEQTHAGAEEPARRPEGRPAAISTRGEDHGVPEGHERFRAP